MPLGLSMYPELVGYLLASFSDETGLEVLQVSVSFCEHETLEDS